MIRLVSGPQEGWLTLLLLTAVVLSPALSLADAAWVEDLWIVPRLAFCSILLGTALAKLPVRGPVAHLFAAVTGLLTVATCFAKMPPGAAWGERILWLSDRVSTWLKVAFGGGVSNDAMLFGLLMALTAWTLGYVSAWFTFRRYNPWPSLVLCGSGLLLNLSYVGDDSGPYLLLFLLSGLLLLVRITICERERSWARFNAELGSEPRRRSLMNGVLVSAGVLACAWAMPVGSVNASLAEGWYVATEPWHDLQAEFGRLFAAIGSTARAPEESRFGKALPLKGVVELGPEPVMLVASPRPEYWAAQTYDRYTGQGWISSADRVTRLEANDSRLAATGLYRGRLEIEQRFKVLSGRASTVFAAGLPLRLSIATWAEHAETLEDLASLRSTIPLRKGYQYGVISSVSAATEIQLRRAGTDYPDWVRRYLELPASSTRRVEATARRLTRGADNPYDAALLLERYLRRLRYDTRVGDPPPDRDAVDWFLFVSRAGYCDYFASAMAVMARSIGIPSRVVSGYNSGSFNEQTGLYEVRQEHAHSWPELFFPGYGWVRFEPTPSQDVPERPPGSADAPEPESDLPEMNLEALGLVDMGDALLLEEDYQVMGSDLPAGSTTAQWPSEGPPPYWAIVPLAGVLALGLAWRRLLSRLRPTRRVYFQMCSLAGLLGWGIRPSDTPSEYGRMLRAAAPELQPEVDLVVTSYVEDVYGGVPRDNQESVARSWRRLRFGLPWRLLRRRVGDRLSATLARKQRP